MISVDHLDHLVLTVADVSATAAFYQRVLGMHPITFGDGRRALAFGNQKTGRSRPARPRAPPTCASSPAHR